MTIEGLDILDRAGNGDGADDSDALLRAVAAAPRPEAVLSPGTRLPANVLAALTPDARQVCAPRPGELVDGRYRIDEVLGLGGMGIVYAATQLATGRAVALKWMRVSPAQRTAAERDAAFRRFAREAQATGRIQHPNVVDVYDASGEPRTPFLVMERLHGQTLRAHLQKCGALTWDEALALLLPAMAGVAEAHRRGVVHRDLKPDNVFLAREHGTLTPKVLDFGVSRLWPSAEDAEDEPSLTRPGSVVGTPAYMPLEQLRAADNLDARTDVYALGVVLYEMLAGKRPYEASNAADFAALLASEEPKPLGHYRPDLQGPREQAVMKALARRPEQRHGSVESFADALRSARAATGQRRVGASTLLMALALVAAGYTAYHHWSGSKLPRRARPLAEPAASAPAARSAAAPGAPAPMQGLVSLPAVPPAAEAVIREALPVRRAAVRARIRGGPPAQKRTAPAAGVDPASTGPAARPRALISLDPADFRPLAAPAPSPIGPSAASGAPSLVLGRDQF